MTTMTTPMRMKTRRSNNFMESCRSIAHYDTAYYLFKDPLTLYTCGRIAETELRDATLARRYYRRYLAVAKLR
jgi:hypothetical protein